MPRPTSARPSSRCRVRWRAKRRSNGNGGDEEAAAETTLSQERYAEMGAAEQVILTISANGYGKRTSSYEYRITGRGGKGIVAMAVNDRNGPLVASFPVEDADQIMLVTDGGQLIRYPGRTASARRAAPPRASSSSMRRMTSTWFRSSTSPRRTARRARAEPVAARLAREAEEARRSRGR